MPPYCESCGVFHTPGGCDLVQELRSLVRRITPEQISFETIERAELVGGADHLLPLQLERSLAAVGSPVVALTLVGPWEGPTCEWTAHGPCVHAAAFRVVEHSRGILISDRYMCDEHAWTLATIQDEATRYVVDLEPIPTIYDPTDQCSECGDRFRECFITRSGRCDDCERRSTVRPWSLR